MGAMVWYGRRINGDGCGTRVGLMGGMLLIARRVDGRDRCVLRVGVSD